MELVVLLAGLAVAGTVAALRGRRRNRRQRTLLGLCRDAGVGFSVVDPFPDTAYLPFRLFGRGDRRGIQNVVWDEGDPDIHVFDSWFEERNEQGVGVTHDMTCGVVPLPFSVPRLAVLPRGVRDPSQEPIEGGRVGLELEAFDRRFDVRSADPRAAVAFLDQRMMEALVHIPLRVAIHVHEDRMLLVGATLEPAEMLVLLEVARALPGRVPRVVASLYPPRPAEGPFEHRWLQGAWSTDPTSASPNRDDLGG
jgi:hypothetical protein